MADSNSNTSRGSHVEDVASTIDNFSDVFGQLAALLKIIKSELGEYTEARKLAELAYYIANDYENLADSEANSVLTEGVFGFDKQGGGKLTTVMANEVTA